MSAGCYVLMALFSAKTKRFSQYKNIVFLRFQYTLMSVKNPGIWLIFLPAPDVAAANTVRVVPHGLVSTQSATSSQWSRGIKVTNHYSLAVADKDLTKLVL